MKLSTITSVSNRPLGLSTLLNEATILTSHKSIKSVNRPFSSFLIEAVIENKTLTEAGANRIGSLLGAGLAGLQSMMTPGTASDVAPLLDIMNPGGGGIAALEKLTSEYQNDKSAVKDATIFSDLFNIFGITDQNEQRTIIEQLKSDLGLRTRPPTTQPPTPTQQPATPAAAPATPQPMAGSDELAQVDQHYATVDDPFATPDELEHKHLVNWLAKQLSSPIRQADPNKVLDDIHNVIIGLIRKRMIGNPPNPQPTQQAQVEGLLNYVAAQLLAESSVQRDIDNIVPNAIRKYYAYHRVPIILKEANWGQWGQKAGEFIGKIPGYIKTGIEKGAQFLHGAQNYLANPHYAQRHLGRHQQNSDNSRTLKYAVQLMADHVRNKFNTTLKTAGLDGASTLEQYRRWKSTTNPQEKQALGAELDKVGQLFGNNIPHFAAPAPPPVVPQQAPAPAPQPVPQPPPPPAPISHKLGNIGSGKSRTMRFRT